MIAKVKYQAIDEKTGKDKIIKEEYILDAISFTEAEEKMYKFFEEEKSTESVVVNISPCNISEVLLNNEDSIFYKCRIAFKDEDPNTGKEKISKTFHLVESTDLKDAYEHLETVMESVLIPYEIESIVKTKIIEYLPHVEPEILHN